MSSARCRGSWEMMPNELEAGAQRLPGSSIFSVGAVILPSISCMHHNQHPLAVKPLRRQNLDLFTRKAWGCYVALTALVGRE